MLAAMGALATTFSDIASYFTVPSMGGLYSPSSGGLTLGKILNKAADLFNIGMPIYPDKYEESGGNEIGTQVLVGGMDSSSLDAVGALTKVMDNVVVNPRTWRIHGYMGINFEHSDAARQMGTFSVLNSFATTFGREELNLAIKKYIRFVTEARKPFKFTTADGDTVPALIQSYSFKDEAENLNWVDVDVEIQEFRAIALSADGGQVVVGGVSGSDKMSSVKQLGTAVMKTVGLRISNFL